MRKPLIALASCLFCLLFAFSAAAQTRYISDTLVVSLRNQPADNSQTLEHLTSNTPVTILGEEGVYFRVSTPSGREGFIPKQYITATIPKAQQVEELQAELASLQQRYASAEEQLRLSVQDGSLQPRLEELSEQLETTRAELKQVTERYETLREETADIVQLVDDKEFLEEQNRLLNEELVVLREENRSFHRTNTIQWFFAGAGVFLGGWFIGKVSRQKQRGFSRL
jgi:SH3 domain protein